MPAWSDPPRSSPSARCCRGSPGWLGSARSPTPSAPLALADAYNLANTTPNIVYELLLGGVLSATLVPVFVDRFDDGDDDAVAAILTVATVALVVLTVGRRARRPGDLRACTAPTSVADAGVPLLRLLPAADAVLRLDRARHRGAERPAPLRRAGLRPGAQQHRGVRRARRLRARGVATATPTLASVTDDRTGLWLLGRGHDGRHRRHDAAAAGPPSGGPACGCAGGSTPATRRCARSSRRAGWTLGYVAANQVGLDGRCSADRRHRPRACRPRLHVRLHLLPAPPRPHRRVGDDHVRPRAGVGVERAATTGATATASAGPAAGVDRRRARHRRPRRRAPARSSASCSHAARSTPTPPTATADVLARDGARPARLLGLPLRPAGLLRQGDTRTPFLAQPGREHPAGRPHRWRSCRTPSRPGLALGVAYAIAYSVAAVVALVLLHRRAAGSSARRLLDAVGSARRRAAAVTAAAIAVVRSAARRHRRPRARRGRGRRRRRPAWRSSPPPSLLRRPGDAPPGRRRRAPATHRRAPVRSPRHVQGHPAVLEVPRRPSSTRRSTRRPIRRSSSSRRSPRRRSSTAGSRSRPPTSSPTRSRPSCG